MLFAGGLNYVAKCAEGTCTDTDPNEEHHRAVGHEFAHRLRTGLETPTWDSQPSVMHRERYYPTVMTDQAGNGLVLGHVASPDMSCPAPWQTFPYSEEIDATREAFQLSSLSFGPLSVNYNRPVAGCDIGPSLVRMADYPRTHMLGRAYLAFTNSRRASNAAHEAAPTSRFMRLDAPGCAGSSLTPDRWQSMKPDMTAPSSTEPAETRRGGSSVHLVTHDANGALVDVVYVIGGTAGDDDVTCSPPPIPPAEPPPAALGSVEKLVIDSSIPQATLAVNAAWQNGPALNHARYNHNTVILPTGRMVVIGGMDYADDECVYRQRIEKYLPPEIGGTAAGWVLGAEQLYPRIYHSVALLLPDGSVLSAGGAYGYPAYHSVEIYYPFYYFSGDRPEITGWPKPLEPGPDLIGFQGVGTTDVFEVGVTLANASDSVSRVVLMRNGGPTHAFDSSQRWVELRNGEPIGTSPNVTIPVTEPENAFVCPPGFYMLFVVNQDNLPSVARWVRVAPGI